ncbi:MAG: glycoside hydrolase family 13 protein [Lapillicoccus sp.]
MTGEKALAQDDTGALTRVPTWLSAPHHDGSALYVSDLAPRLGRTVTVWLRVPVELDLSDVHVRTVLDGEPAFVAATVDRRRTDGTDTWWRARLRCHNPVTSYRWVMVGGPTGYAWVNGTGVHLRDVPDASDFRLVAHPSPPPLWARDAVVYQIFPDRFAKSARSVLAGRSRKGIPEWAVPARWTDPVHNLRGEDLGRQLYGGDLDGVTEHLDHLERLGADVVYLTPFFPGRSNHRYDASTFDAVDPVLGGDEALRRLTGAAHERGLKVLGDVTTNHTGNTHEWFLASRADPQAPERDFYFWTSRDEYVGWLGVASLPKLNYDSTELRHRVFDDPRGVVQRWLGADGGLDGWRVDVANMTGRQGGQDRYHEVATWMRESVVAARPGALVVGEHVHDYSLDVPGDGWHGVMNYAGFTKPVWTWLCDAHDPPDFLGSPVVVPRLGGEAVVETMREFTSHISWQALTHSFNLVGSHDTTRIRSLVDRDPRLVELAAGLLLTMPSVPMITYGDEIGMEGTFGEDGRRPMPWDERRWDSGIFEAYRALISARRASVALRHGGLRWVYAAADVLVYLREAAGETALVHVARAAHEPVRIESRRLPGVDGGHAAYGPAPEVAHGTVTLTATGPQVSVYSWEPRRVRRGRTPRGG